MPTLKHKFTSAKADGTDSTLVKPSNWNAEHDHTVATKSVLGATAPGQVAELPLVTTAGPDDGTIWTKAAIEEAIAAAVGAFAGFTTGDVTSSMAASKAGWLLMFGQTIGNVGSSATFANASAQALFTMFWSMTTPVWPILNPDGTLGVKGASADADWIALKKIAIPDMRGRVIAAADDMGGTFAGRLGSPSDAGGIETPATLGASGGKQGCILDWNQMPPHTHATGPFNQTYSGNSNVGGLFGYMIGNNLSGVTGSSGAGFGHNNVQPTYVMNTFIKL